MEGYPAERDEARRCFVPEILVEHISNSLFRGQENIEPMSVFMDGVCLLVDISGFTKLSSSYCEMGKDGIDQLQLATNGYLGRLVDVIYKFGGDIIKFAGDAIICFFSAKVITQVVKGNQGKPHRRYSISTGTDPLQAAAGRAAALAAGIGIDTDRGSFILSGGESSRDEIDEGLPGYGVVHPAEVAGVMEPTVVLRAIHCAHTLKTIETDKLTVHVALSCGEVCFGVLGGYENRWECLVSGPCIQQLSGCLDDAHSREAVMTSDCARAVDGYWKLLGGGTGSPGLGLLRSMSIDEGPSMPEYSITTHQLASGNFKIDCIELVKDVSSSTPTTHTMTAAANGTCSTRERDAHAQIRPLIGSFVPIPVLQSLEDGRECSLTYLAEMREVTTMFMKWDSYDAAGKHRDLLELQQHFYEAQHILHHSGAFLRQFLVDDKGCVLIACWGVPTMSYTDNAHRALSSAAQIRVALLKLNMVCSFGITTGDVYCGTVGSPLRMEYAMIGNVVNMAARLMGKAKGDILIDDETHTRLPESALSTLETMTPIKVKGRDKPLPVHKYKSQGGALHIHRKKIEDHEIRETCKVTLLSLLDTMSATNTGGGSSSSFTWQMGGGSFRASFDGLAKRLMSPSSSGRHANTRSSSSNYGGGGGGGGGERGGGGGGDEGSMKISSVRSTHSKRSASATSSGRMRRTVLIEGERGTGKGALLKWLRSHANDREIRHVLVRLEFTDALVEYSACMKMFAALMPKNMFANPDVLSGAINTLLTEIYGDDTDTIENVALPAMKVAFGISLEHMAAGASDRGTGSAGSTAASSSATLQARRYDLVSICELKQISSSHSGSISFMPTFSRFIASATAAGSRGTGRTGALEKKRTVPIFLVFETILKVFKHLLGGRGRGEAGGGGGDPKKKEDDSPVLLLIDSVHFADVESLRVLVKMLQFEDTSSCVVMTAETNRNKSDSRKTNRSNNSSNNNSNDPTLGLSLSSRHSSPKHNTALEKSEWNQLYRGQIARLPSTKVVKVENFTPSEIEKMLRVALNVSKVPTDIITLVQDFSGGSSFWVREILHYVQEHGVEAFTDAFGGAQQQSQYLSHATHSSGDIINNTSSGQHYTRDGSGGGGGGVEEADDRSSGMVALTRKSSDLSELGLWLTRPASSFYSSLHSNHSSRSKVLPTTSAAADDADGEDVIPVEGDDEHDLSSDQVTPKSLRRQISKLSTGSLFRGSVHDEMHSNSSYHKRSEIAPTPTPVSRAVSGGDASGTSVASSKSISSLLPRFLSSSSSTATTPTAVAAHRLDRKKPTSNTGAFRMEQLVVSRFEKLSIEAQHVLRTASIIGMTFSRDVLYGVLSGAMRDGMFECLHTLLVQKWLYQDYIDDALFQFAHPYSHGVIYALTPPNERKAVHTQVAKYMEAHCNDDPSQYAKCAAHCLHYDTDKALQYVVRATAYILDRDDLMEIHECVELLFLVLPRACISHYDVQVLKRLVREVKEAVEEHERQWTATARARETEAEMEMAKRASQYRQRSNSFAWLSCTSLRLEDASPPSTASPVAVVLSQPVSAETVGEGCVEINSSSNSDNNINNNNNNNNNNNDNNNNNHVNSNSSNYGDKENKNHNNDSTDATSRKDQHSIHKHPVIVALLQQLSDLADMLECKDADLDRVGDTVEARAWQKYYLHLTSSSKSTAGIGTFPAVFATFFRSTADGSSKSADNDPRGMSFSLSGDV